EAPQIEAPKPQRKRLSYKLERELKLLPAKIEKCEAQIVAFNEQLGDSEFYARDADGFFAVTKQLEETKAKLERYESRWLELEEEKVSS
ncbi:MAG: ABC transporter ATP-binding protein, partial [Alphaproteobacteria bacterium]